VYTFGNVFLHCLLVCDATDHVLNKDE